MSAPTRHTLPAGLASALFPGSATAAAAPTAATPAPVPTDPIPALCREAKTARAAMDVSDSEATSDACYERWAHADEQAIGTRATTVPGAIVSLEWAREEIVEWLLEGELCPGDHLILALIDGALGVLRQTGGVA